MQLVQTPQVFTFGEVTLNEDHKNLGSKESLAVKYKDNICTNLCLKHWFKSDWYVSRKIG